MAARELGEPPFTVADLAAEIVWPEALAVGLVEGVGGPRSPIAADGDNVDLARALQPHLVVVVGDAGLGTINAVRLSVGAFDDFPVVVALNRFGDDPLHERNREFLVERRRPRRGDRAVRPRHPARGVAGDRTSRSSGAHTAPNSEMFA